MSPFSRRFELLSNLILFSNIMWMQEIITHQDPAEGFNINKINLSRFNKFKFIKQNVVPLIITKKIKIKDSAVMPLHDLRNVNLYHGDNKFTVEKEGLIKDVKITILIKLYVIYPRRI